LIQIIIEYLITFTECIALIPYSVIFKIFRKTQVGFQAKLKVITLSSIQVSQVSTSTTFYEQLFQTKEFSTDFMFVIVWQENTVELGNNELYGTISICLL